MKRETLLMQVRDKPAGGFPGNRMTLTGRRLQVPVKGWEGAGVVLLRWYRGVHALRIDGQLKRFRRPSRSRLKQ